MFGFRARTLFWDRRTAEARIIDFPDEPVMDWLVSADGGALSSHGEQARLRILRYIPLRRVTFLLEDAAGLPNRVIAKTKRTKSIVRATRALVSARRAAERAGVDTFRLPQPVRLDARRRLLYLAELPGRALPDVLAAGDLDRAAALHRLGRVHREVHELDPTHVRVRRTDDWLAITAVAADQIAALVPSTGPRVAALVARLATATPDDADLAFCQGDFVPSQILCDPGGWAVLDFDDAHHADPHAEVAALYVALGRELPHESPADADAARRGLPGGVRGAGRAAARPRPLAVVRRRRPGAVPRATPREGPRPDPARPAPCSTRSTPAAPTYPTSDVTATNSVIELRTAPGWASSTSRRSSNSSRSSSVITAWWSITPTGRDPDAAVSQELSSLRGGDAPSALALGQPVDGDRDLGEAAEPERFGRGVAGHRPDALVAQGRRGRLAAAVPGRHEHRAGRRPESGAHRRPAPSQIGPHLVRATVTVRTRSGDRSARGSRGPSRAGGARGSTAPSAAGAPRPRGGRAAPGSPPDRSVGRDR